MRHFLNRQRKLAVGLRAPIVAASILLATAGTAEAHYPKVELNEMTHASDVVMIGTVTARTPWTGADGIMVFTDITLSDVELVTSADRAVDIADGGDVVITMAGGDDGVRAMSVCCSPDLKVGERYMIFTQYDGKRYANPIIGGNQGVFRIVGDQRSGDVYPVTAHGQAVLGVTDGSIRTTDRVLQIIDGMATIDRPEGLMEDAPVAGEPGRDSARTRTTDEVVQVLTLNQFRDAVQDLARGPAPEDPILRGVGRFGGAPEFALPSQRVVHEPGGRPLTNGLTPDQPQMVDSQPRLPGDLDELRRFRESMTVATPDAALPTATMTDEARAALCYCGYFDLFLTMEQVPSDWWSYDENNSSMWEFNQVMDIFRYVASDGGIGDNSDNEFAGWVSQSTLNSLYGFNWGSALALNITWFPSGCPCCEMSQTDIMFNPAYSWTESFDYALGNNSVINYKPVVYHELGHAWGLQRGSCVEDYSYNRPSIMHAYYSNIVEDGLGMHSWDAYALRELYDNQTSVPARQDIGVESYYSNGGSLANTTTNTTYYQPGDPITIRDITVENMSSASTSNLRIRFFLSTNDIISTGDTQIGSYWNWSSFSAGSWWTGDLSTSIPSNMAPGTYYVGAIVSRNGSSYSGDNYSNNNSTYLYNTIEVRPVNDYCSDALFVGEGTYSFDTTNAWTDGYTHSSCQFDGQTYNDVWYRFTPSCDGVLTVSTCNQADYDTDIVVYRYTGVCPPFSSQVVGCNDDASGCSGYSSRVIANVNRDEELMIRVGGYQSDDEGSGQLTVSLTPVVVNDDCSDALPIGNGDTFFDTTCATTDGLAHSRCQFDGQTYHDIWYLYTAECTGRVTISTCGQAEYDTDLVLYTTGGHCPPTDAQLLECNDDASGCSGYSSRIQANVVEGRTYRLRVGGYASGNQGEGLLTIDCQPLCPDANGDNSVDFADLEILLDNWGAIVTPGTNGDVNNSGSVNFADLNLLLDAWGTTCN